MALPISETNPAILTATIDPNHNVELFYGDHALTRHGDAIDVFTDDPCVTIRICDIGTTWESSATHQQGENWVSWTQLSTGGCEHCWAETNGEVAVLVEFAGSSGSTSKTIYIRIRPGTEKPA